MTPEDAITAALDGTPRPLSWTELLNPVRSTGTAPTDQVMSRVLTRLVAARRIVRRPSVPPGAEVPRSLREMDVRLCDFHPAGRDPWPYGVGYSEERPCEVCGAYVTYTDDGPPPCGEPCEARRAA